MSPRPRDIDDGKNDHARKPGNNNQTAIFKSGNFQDRKQNINDHEDGGEIQREGPRQTGKRHHEIFGMMIKQSDKDRG